MVSIENKEGMKQCTKCKQWKDKTEFNKKSNTRDGLDGHCRECKAK
ncbi:unnamed protein product, partial [marine sediment metagenome]